MRSMIFKQAISTNNSSAPQILIVDDKYENRLALKKLLSDLNVSIVEADSGNNALKEIIHQNFALILLDLHMPDMDGVEVLELIHDNPATQHTPVILITADHTENVRYITAYEKGAVDFLYKPVIPNILLSKVKVFIDLYNSQEDYKKLSLQHELILNSAGEGICGLDSYGKIVSSNPVSHKIAEQNINGLLVSSLLYKSDGSSLTYEDKENIYKSIFNQTDYRSDEFVLKTNNGYNIPVSLAITPVLSDHKDLSAVFVFSDITESKKLEKRLNKLARYDSLTGLANRTLFYENLSKAISRAERNHNKFTLYFIDLDQFKQVNDTMGHAAGDSLLTQFSQRLIEGFRNADSISRLGGDEFTLIAEDVKDLNEARIIAEKLKNVTKEPYLINNKLHHVSISTGIAIFPDSGKNLEMLLRNADTALYQAKAKGRNNFQFFSNNLMTQVTRKVEVENKLRSAIKNDELELFYQPKINLQNCKITGFEALIRWNDPDKGYILPDHFINIAEESDIILDIGEWVLEKACQQKKLWISKGMAENIKIAINLSAKHMNKSNFISSIKNILNQFNLDDLSMEFELTETAVMHNIEKAITMLHEVHEMGISVAIDDFGMGYSSLNQLKRLPVDTLKIDKSFIKDIHTSHNDAAIVKAIINIAENMEMNVIAEGIESTMQLDYLKSFNCIEGQGFHFYKPLPAQFITNELINEHTSF